MQLKTERKGTVEGKISEMKLNQELIEGKMQGISYRMLSHKEKRKEEANSETDWKKGKEKEEKRQEVNSRIEEMTEGKRQGVSMRAETTEEKRQEVNSMTEERRQGVSIKVETTEEKNSMIEDKIEVRLEEQQPTESDNLSKLTLID